MVNKFKLCSKTKNASALILHIGDVMSTSLAKIVALGFPLTYLWQGQIYSL